MPTFVPPTEGQALHVRVYLAFGFTSKDDPGTWVFTNITDRVKGPVTLSGGTSSQGSSPTTMQIGCTLANDDGALTARNPLSIYWPGVKRNTPLKVTITWDGATGEYELGTAFVNGFPLDPISGAAVVRVPIVATGRLRRLQRSNKRVVSAMTRTIPQTSPIAWWPLEDGSRSTQAASGLVAGRPMQILQGTVSFASGDGPGGAGPLADLSTGGQLLAGLPAITASSYRMEFAMKCPTVSDFIAVMDWYTPTGGIDVWEILVTDGPDGGLYVQWLAPDGVTSAQYFSNVAVDDNAWHHVRIDMSNSGGNHKIIVTLDGAAVINQTTARTWGVANRILVNPTGSPNEEIPSFGQLAVWAPWSGSIDTYAAFTGFVGETAADRVARLCEEIGIPLVVNTSTDVPSQAMGPQGVDTLANLLAACADIDNGSLHDAGPLGSLVYVSGTARYNAAIAMTVDYVRHQIGDGLASTYDDQDLVTDTTVSRDGGSSARYIDPTADDDYAVSPSVNAATDAQLSSLATWRGHLGALDAYRIPSIPIDILGRSPELAQAATSLVVPARISPTNLPVPYPPESLDQFAEGFQTVVDSVTWQTTYSCSPYAPWQAARYDVSKYDSHSSSLATGISKVAVGATSTLSVATANPGDLWTTDSAEWTVGQRGPLYLCLRDSEIVRVTNITGTSSPQTMTVVRGQGGYTIAHPAGAEVRIYPPAVLAL